MITKTILLGTAAWLLAGGAAYAQTAPAEPDPAEVEEVVVTGVRASLQTAQETKRNADTIVDSIAAEDIGKLPDNTVSDALQRVTGVQVQRSAGEVTQVLIRGLPNIQSLLNGREVFTGTGRGLALQDIPAELLAGVDVYKATTPNQLEGGVGGSINIRLRRPFDLDDRTIAGSIRAIYTDQAEEYSGIGSLVVSDRWDTGGGEFGALIGVSFNRFVYEDQTAFNFISDQVISPGPTPPAGTAVLKPITTGGFIRSAERERPAVNFALQWRPNAELELHLDGIYTGYREDYNNDFLIGIPGASAFGSATLQPGTNFAKTYVAANAFTLTSQQAIHSETDSYQLSGGGEWERGPLTVSGEVTYNDSTVTNTRAVLDTFFIVPQLTADFDRGGTPFLNFGGVDASNPANFSILALFDDGDMAESTQTAFQGDATYDLEDGFIGEIQFGARYASREVSFGGPNTGPIGLPPGLAPPPLTSIAGLASTSANVLFEGDLGVGRYVVANADVLRDDIGRIRQLFGRPTGAPADDPARVFNDEETTLAGYVLARYAFDMGAVPVDGVAGVRVVETEQDLSGFRSTNGVFTPATTSQKFTDTLPSVNARFELRDDVFLRLSYTKTLTRPEFIDLNPAISLNIAGNTTIGTGAGGNPALEPVRSSNYDASLEWYFAPTGYLSGAVFHRDLDGYIQLYAENETIGGQIFNVTRPRNTGSGELKGFEIAYQQFFDFLPEALKGFGAQANFTYAEGETEDPINGGVQDIVNVSRRAYNLIGIYERAGFSARLAYNWRSRFTVGYNSGGLQPTTIIAEPLERLDFSASYDLTEAVTISFDANNLLDEKYQDYFGTTATPRDTRQYDRYFAVGARFRF